VAQADSATFLALAGNMDDAGKVFERAITSLQQLQASGGGSSVSPYMLNEVCWAGAVLGQPSRVLPSCDAAVKADRSPELLDSRGLAHGLANHVDTATADLSAFIAASLKAKDTVANRQERNLRRLWIAEMRAGEKLDAAEIRGQLARTP
jgi:hypothetical protein